MKLTKIFVLLLFLAGSKFLIAQEKLIRGQITNTLDIEGIHILNTSSRYNSVTNAIGQFFIKVKPQDTLLISSIAYVPERIIVSKLAYQSSAISITLTPLVNELEEVYLGPTLTGDLERDLKKIDVEEPINFDDVGIPGFQGTPEEKIPKLVGQVITPTAVNIEGLYKYISGYYKKLRLQRKWQRQNVLVSQLIFKYSSQFFVEAYELPEERVYDFILYCVENTSIGNHFQKENYGVVVSIFETEAKEYILRLQVKEE